ncbi:primosomal protein DnaI [Bacillus sp. CGMCC 1.16607]|uniref:primosomal protein DnaI n=1 Tax=Bacillus sp. CGMCC 1.16607 TaxID=3351842 RepID=UPI00362B669B
MEKINQTLKRLSLNENFQKLYDQQKQEVLKDPHVITFINQNRETITNEIIDKNIMKLYEYSSQSKECEKCSDLANCVNMLKGYQPELVLNRQSIDLEYHRCPRKILSDDRRKSEKLIQSLYVPKDILKASFADIQIDDRMDAIDRAELFVENYQTGVRSKGLYFYGKFGVGKSYLLGAMANELAEKGISSMIVYFPELVRELKASIGDQTLNQKIEMIKKAPILMLDDIGAETMSSWLRDEVLGPILQFRMLEELPTFFTSNFEYEGLEHHLTYSQRGEEEKIKARRLMERIRYLTEAVEVIGRNRRN